MKIISVRKNDRSETLRSVFRKHFQSLTERLNPYRSLNLIQLIQEIKLRKSCLRSLPIVARINVCPICNLKCPGCMGRADLSGSGRMMTLKTFQEIVDKIHAHVMLLILYDEGEPLLHPDLEEMIRYAASRNISTSVSSNLAMKLSPARIESLVTSGLNRLRVGMDGITQETYERYRVNGNLQRLKCNLEQFIHFREKWGQVNPVVEVQFLDFGYNSHERDAVREYALDAGVDDFNAFRADPGDVWVEYSGSEESRISMGCSGLWMTLYISNDGVMYPCNFGEDRDMASVGSILNGDLDLLWNSDTMVNLRRSFHHTRGGLITPQCRICPETQALPRLLR